MFFIVSKILSYFFRPTVWVIILLFLALFHKNSRIKKRSLIGGLMILVLFSNTFLVTKVAGLWTIAPKEITETYDVGIVLGGSTITYDKKYNRKIFKGNIDRLLQAVELYERGKIKRILITGGSGNLIYRKTKEAKLMQSFLLSIHIPPQDILMDTLAKNTHENAVYSAQILMQHPELKKVLLFTSSLHMRRALACFRHEGIEATPYPTNLINSSIHWNIEYLVIPSIANFLIWNGMLHEMIGYPTYKFMGYI